MTPEPLLLAQWHVVVPVKGGPAAKSRLHPPSGVSRWSLAFAIAEDCLRAVATALDPGRVVVVSSDEAVTDLAATLGTVLVADPQDGLDSAARTGIAAAVAQGAGPVAVLLGDLPALLSDDLVEALSELGRHAPAFVPDHAGTGTALLGSADPLGMPLAFGPHSAAAHERAGYQRLDLDLPRLRTDVDDDSGLQVALRLGVGPSTRAVLSGAFSGR